MDSVNLCCQVLVYMGGKTISLEFEKGENNETDTKRGVNPTRGP